MIAFSQYAPSRPKNRMTTAMRKYVKLLKHGHTCTYCGRDLLSDPDTYFLANVDHFMPRCKGGKNEQANKFSCCQVCNLLKGADVFATIREAREAIMERRQKLEGEYLRFLFTLPLVPRRYRRKRAKEMVNDLFAEQVEA
jgi:5-methylcytosine-specific restriction endonuclease McrA